MSENTKAEHQAIVESFKELAHALPASAVQTSGVPIATFLQESFIAVGAAREFQAELEAVGYPAANTLLLESRLKGLLSAQRLWGESRKGRRGEDALALIENAENLRQNLLSASLLALRKDRHALGKLDAIRDGDGFADLADDLSALALLLTSYTDAFSSIKINIEETSQQAVETSKSLLQLLSDEAVQNAKIESKTMRDRIYTLCLEPLNELRAFAAYAFKDDESPKRRQIFFSSYDRKIQARYRRKQQEQMQAELEF